MKKYTIPHNAKRLCLPEVNPSKYRSRAFLEKSGEFCIKLDTKINNSHDIFDNV